MNINKHIYLPAMKYALAAPFCQNEQKLYVFQTVYDDSLGLKGLGVLYKIQVVVEYTENMLISRVAISWLKGVAAAYFDVLQTVIIYHPRGKSRNFRRLCYFDGWTSIILYSSITCYINIFYVPAAVKIISINTLYVRRSYGNYLVKAWLASPNQTCLASTFFKVCLAM